MGKCRIVLRRLEYFGSAAGDHSGGFVILTTLEYVNFALLSKEVRVEVFYAFYRSIWGCVLCSCIS